MKKILYSLVFIIVGMLTSCNEVFARENVPYIVNGNFVMEKDFAEFEVCGIDLYFLNKADKEVENFTVVFSLFDENGEPAATTKNSLVFTVSENLDPKESVNLCLSLDDYITYIPTEDYFIDYLYVSRISYSDGTVWSDPYGLQVF